MEEMYMLLMLSFVMLVGSYIAGSIPLFIQFSEDKLNKFTAFGAGLLVGTALSVIIPEGVRALAGQSDGQVSIVDGSKTGGDSLSLIGISLVLGFVFMLLVDQLTQRRNRNLSYNDRNVSATIGLVVHAAADGVALGAAATTSHTDVEFIVFLAIMLHKAPAAFGLVTFLLHEGIGRDRVRRHLAIFAAAAPIATLCTYLGIGQEQRETLNSLNATGIAMLFSAGTFLYVATVHVLAELTQSRAATPTLSASGGSYVRVQLLESAPSTSNPSVAPHSSNILTLTELCCLIFGCMLPLLLSLGHDSHPAHPIRS